MVDSGLVSESIDERSCSRCEQWVLGCATWCLTMGHFMTPANPRESVDLATVADQDVEDFPKEASGKYSKEKNNVALCSFVS